MKYNNLIYYDLQEAHFIRLSLFRCHACVICHAQTNVMTFGRRDVKLLEAPNSQLRSDSAQAAKTTVC